jgi:hypothetical protein
MAVPSVSGKAWVGMRDPHDKPFGINTFRRNQPGPLASIAFPESLVRIGDAAFTDTSLAGLRIPDTVTSIDRRQDTQGQPPPPGPRAGCPARR